VRTKALVLDYVCLSQAEIRMFFAIDYDSIKFSESYPSNFVLISVEDSVFFGEKVFDYCLQDCEDAREKSRFVPMYGSISTWR